MKPLALLVFFVCFFSFGKTNAQFYMEADAGYISPLALNQANYGFSELEYIYRSGWQAGLGFGYSFGPSHRIRLNFLYSAQGASYRSELKEVEHERLISLDYLQIPLQYNLVSEGNGGSTHFTVSIGPYIGLLLNADQSWSVGGQSQSMLAFQASQNRNLHIADLTDRLPGDGNPDDYKELFESLDIGLTGSLGVVIDLTDALFFIGEGTAGIGFSDINAESWRYTNSAGEYEKTQNLYAGIRIGLGLWLSGSEE